MEQLWYVKYVMEVLSSNLVETPANTTKIFHDFLQSLRTNAGIVLTLRKTASFQTIFNS
jgi:hypothetical protein